MVLYQSNAVLKHNGPESVTSISAAFVILESNQPQMSSTTQGTRKKGALFQWNQGECKHRSHCCAWEFHNFLLVALHELANKGENMLKLHLELWLIQTRSSLCLSSNNFEIFLSPHTATHCKWNSTQCRTLVKLLNFAQVGAENHK